MSVLFRVVYAAKCQGTHHKLAMDALRYLEGPNSENWVRLFLKHADSLVEGSKAPDKRFRDFRNHVLHVAENNWGGAIKTSRKWYDQTVQSLRNQNWKEAVYSAGVLSHYYCDPVQPFHTGQSEEETQIHRAVEWSISKSYDDLFAMYEDRYQDQVNVNVPSGEAWLEQMVLEAANHSHQSYRETIDRYQFDLGVQNPPEGLDTVLRETYAQLLGYAALGFARILERLFQEAAVAPVEVSLNLESVLSGLEIPVKWVTRKVHDHRERRLIEEMYQELTTTGRIRNHLPEDDRFIREKHAEEILQVPLSQLTQQPLGAIGQRYGKDVSPLVSEETKKRKRDWSTSAERARMNRVGTVTTIEVLRGNVTQEPAPVGAAATQPVSKQEPRISRPGERVKRKKRLTPRPGFFPETREKTRNEVVEKPVVKSRPTVEQARVTPSQQSPLPQQRVPSEKPRVTSVEKPEQETPATLPVPQQEEKLKFYLDRSRPLVDAPSIGPKTAKRFRRIGVNTVDDFLTGSPEAMAAEINMRHITPAEIMNWQDQTELVCRIPNLRGHDAQILVYSGIRKPEELIGRDPQGVLEQVMPFVESKQGDRILRGSCQPDLEEVTNWIRWAGHARLLRAA